MSNFSRRQLISTALAATGGASALTVAAHLAKQDALLPPDGSGLYGPGEILNYATHRLLGRQTHAREFSRDQISPRPFANRTAPPTEAYKQLQAAAFADWRLEVGGMVARPARFSLAELRSHPVRSQITHIACEEGWSYIAEWSGVPLFHVLNLVEVHPQAKYVVYSSMQQGWWDSIDMSEALHPQTQLTYQMNGEDLPPAHGGPLRMRVPRQLAYKSVKFINKLTVTDSLKSFGKGLGSAAPEDGYSWYAGI